MSEKKPTLEYATPRPRRYTVNVPRTRLGKLVAGLICLIPLAWLLLMSVNMLRRQIAPRRPSAVPASTRPSLQPAQKSSG